MKVIITEEMRYRQKVVEYAKKHKNNAKAARRYHTSRQQVWRWCQRYDGTIGSLANKSRRPHNHPNQHTTEELKLIKHKYRYHGHEGLAQVYRKLRESGYTRTYDSMCIQIRKLKLNSRRKQHSYPKSMYKKSPANYPGERIQIDIKYVPVECIGFASFHSRYYQITAIDEYSRKRYMELTDEKSSYSTSEFVKRLEKGLGFKVKLAQTDNGFEFVNDADTTSKKSRFEKQLKKQGIGHKRIRPYSPWQNGIVERSHRIDNDLFYNKRRFNSYKEMLKAFERYSKRYNKIARKILGFKSPNEVVEEYFSGKVALVM